MNPCSVLPKQDSPLARECVSFLLANYIFVKRVGKGEMSVIARLDETKTDGPQQKIVCKIMPLDENAIQDISIACQLNDLHDETPVFVLTFGWLACSEIPQEWRQYMFQLPEGVDWSTDMLVFQIMDFAPETWADKSLTLLPDEYEAMLFLLLHGLYVARRRLGSFSHNDIHEGQLLLYPCAPNTIIQCRVEKTVFAVTCQRFVPKLIDFGLSTTQQFRLTSANNYSEDEDDGLFEKAATAASADANSDVKDLIIEFERRMKKDGMKQIPKRSSFLEDALQSAASDHQVIAEVLLNDGRFKRVAQKQNKKHKQDAAAVNCMVCHSLPAQFEWQNTMLKFCTAHCAEKWANIGGMMNPQNFLDK